jgi:hypothetical protein
MGLHDLYPFVLGPLAVAKLTFVQQRILEVSPRKPEIQGGRGDVERSVLARVRSQTT